MKKFCITTLTVFSIILIGSVATYGIKEVDK